MTITVIVGEKEDYQEPGYAGPLMYPIEMDDDIDTSAGAFVTGEEHYDEVMHRVAEARADETGEEVEDIIERYELYFAFEGDPDVSMDWRAS